MFFSAQVRDWNRHRRLFTFESLNSVALVPESACSRRRLSWKFHMSETARKLTVFPAFHKVDGARVVVAGGGEEAAAKVRLLAETSATIELFHPTIDQGTAADLRAAGGSWHARIPGAEDFAAAALAFIATGDEASDRAAAELAKAAGVPVNVVDRPELCDFFTGAMVNRAPLAVAVTTAGAAPVLARHVRARVEALLAPAFGDLAALAEKLRGAVGSAIGTAEGRRRFWARFFTGSVAEKIFAGKVDEAEAEARHDLSAPALTQGHVSLVGAGPGAEDLLTLRAQRLLQEADVIVYDALVPERVVAMGRRDAKRIHVGKTKGSHRATQEEINALLVEEAKAGHQVVRLKSGDPLIFGRAGEEIAALRAAGVSFDVVPGITAAFAAAAETEIPLTLRGVASALVFATGHDEHSETLPGWAGVALSGATVAVYMGHSVAGKVATQLIAAGLNASTPVALIENASRADQRACAGRLDELARLAARPELEGPVLIVIGEVVAHSALNLAPAALSELVAA
jgi:uroporphyrin-III C-methyltransferase/precorrin-2 dehydrogenase/sirohydrochlorin ferrochelatase